MVAIDKRTHITGGPVSKKRHSPQVWCLVISSGSKACHTSGEVWEGGEGGLGPKRTTMAQQDFPDCKLRFFPRWSLWSCGGGGVQGRGGAPPPMVYGHSNPPLRTSRHYPGFEPGPNDPHTSDTTIEPRPSGRDTHLPLAQAPPKSGEGNGQTGLVESLPVFERPRRPQMSPPQTCSAVLILLSYEWRYPRCPPPAVPTPSSRPQPPQRSRGCGGPRQPQAIAAGSPPAASAGSAGGSTPSP